MSELPEAEVWSDETIAEFHLNNAMGAEDYRDAIAEVLKMGIDPTSLNPDHVIIGDRPWRHPELYMETMRNKQSL